MAEFNLKEVLVKAGKDTAENAKEEAAAATVRAIKRIANPPKKALPAPVLTKTPAPPWFRYGIYAAVGLVAFKLIKSVAD